MVLIFKNKRIKIFLLKVLRFFKNKKIIFSLVYFKIYNKLIFNFECEWIISSHFFFLIFWIFRIIVMLGLCPTMTHGMGISISGRARTVRSPNPLKLDQTIAILNYPSNRTKHVLFFFFFSFRIFYIGHWKFLQILKLLNLLNLFVFQSSIQEFNKSSYPYRNIC